MKESINITSDELTQIRDLQSKFQEKIFNFGHLYLEKIRIEREIKLVSEKEQKLQSEIDELKKQEDQFIDSISKKYGDGSLDLSKGVFIPE